MRVNECVRVCEMSRMIGLHFRCFFAFRLRPITCKLLLLLLWDSGRLGEPSVGLHFQGSPGPVLKRLWPFEQCALVIIAGEKSWVCIVVCACALGGGGEVSSRSLIVWQCWCLAMAKRIQFKKNEESPEIRCSCTKYRWVYLPRKKIGRNIKTRYQNSWQVESAPVFEIEGLKTPS